MVLREIQNSFFLKDEREIQIPPILWWSVLERFSLLSLTSLSLSFPSKLSSLLVCESLLCSHTQVDDGVNDDIKELLDVNRYTE